MCSADGCVEDQEDQEGSDEEDIKEDEQEDGQTDENEVQVNQISLIIKYFIDQQSTNF